LLPCVSKTNTTLEIAGNHSTFLHGDTPIRPFWTSSKSNMDIHDIVGSNSTHRSFELLWRRVSREANSSSRASAAIESPKNTCSAYWSHCFQHACFKTMIRTRVEQVRFKEFDRATGYCNILLPYRERGVAGRLTWSDIDSCGIISVRPYTPARTALTTTNIMGRVLLETHVGRSTLTRARKQQGLLGPSRQHALHPTYCAGAHLRIGPSKGDVPIAYEQMIRMNINKNGKRSPAFLNAKL